MCVTGTEERAVKVRAEQQRDSVSGCIPENK